MPALTTKQAIAAANRGDPYSVSRAYSSRVKKLQTRALRKKRTDSNAEYIQQMKDVPCADCGVKYPYYVMDFDHVSGSKVGNVGRMRGKSRSMLDREIEKCDVVCANCHRERTQSRPVPVPILL